MCSEPGPVAMRSVISAPWPWTPTASKPAISTPLVGAWPADRTRYDERSPLLHADRIRCPVLFFQGLQDKVVPPEQTERMAAALRANGVAVEVRLFEQEGHGFRDSAVQIQVLEETEAFFRERLGI